MFPAARIGDPITHDLSTPCGLIGPPPSGPPNVIIEGMPAAVVTCQLACTGVTGAGPVHPPPPGPPPQIVLGCPRVFIVGLQAARWVAAPDLGACGVFLGNPAAAGARTVFIGDLGGGGGGAGTGATGAGGGGGSLVSVAAGLARVLGLPAATVDEVAEDQGGPLAPADETSEETTWIGITLESFDGKPIANESLQVTLNDGTMLSGTTDAKGHARFDGVPAGSGQVVFPNILTPTKPSSPPPPEQPPDAPFEPWP